MSLTGPGEKYFINRPYTGAYIQQGAKWARAPRVKKKERKGKGEREKRNKKRESE